jgi:hypothetical protein
MAKTKSKWTTKTPTEKGYYWFKAEPENSPVVVRIMFGRAFLHGYETAFSIRDFLGLWYGPIKEPK